MSPGSGTPEVPALPHRSLVPPPAAEPEVRLCGSGQLKGGLRVLRGPRSQRGRGCCWALACGAGSGFGVPTPRLPLPGPFAPAPSENLPPSPGEESHVLQSAPSVALIRGPSEGAPAPAGRRRRLWSHRSPVWEGREAPSQERPSPRNALENNPDPASCPKPVALSSPAQGRCWGLGDGPVCARVSRGGGEREGGRLLKSPSCPFRSCAARPGEFRGLSSHRSSGRCCRASHSRGRRLQDSPVSG